MPALRNRPARGFNGAASHRGGGRKNTFRASNFMDGLQRGRLSSRRRTARRARARPPRRRFNGAASHRGGGRKPASLPTIGGAKLQRGRLSSRRRTPSAIRSSSYTTVRSFNGAASHRGGGPGRNSSGSIPKSTLQRGRLSSRRRTRFIISLMVVRRSWLQRGRLCDGARPADRRSFNGAASHRGGGHRGGVSHSPDVHTASTGPPLIEAEDLRAEGLRVDTEVNASTGPPLIEAEDSRHRQRAGRAAGASASTGPPLIEAEDGPPVESTSSDVA